VNIFIFGAGYSAKAFARDRALPETVVSGTTRSPDKFDDLRNAGIAPLIYDGDPSPELLQALDLTTHLVVSIAPDDGGDPVLQAFSDTIRRSMPKLEWIGYLSTVGVYGDHQGGWVQETAECRPVSRRSKLRVEAEQAWQSLADEVGKPLAILRLSGIYGPGRNAFVNLDNGTAKRLIKAGQVFNRIHAADIAGALWHLANRNLGGIFNVTDDEPAPPQDVVAYAADLMGVAPPPEIPFETAQLSPMARSFYGENKRVSNGKLKATGYAFRFPNYRGALLTMWNDDTWRGVKKIDARSPIKPD
jgi:nucleoside-diphosphate-sugar epimerase